MSIETPALFPIMWPHDRKEKAALHALGCPLSVPWSILAPHEERAQRNHSQTLKCLAERGGLSPGEMASMLLDLHWRPFIPDYEAVPIILCAIRRLSSELHMSGRKDVKVVDDGRGDTLTMEPVDLLGQGLRLRIVTSASIPLLGPAEARAAAGYMLAWADKVELPEPRPTEAT